MMDLKYVLDNLIEKRFCAACAGWWFRFNHEGVMGYYRLSPLAPGDCPTCKPLDEEIEAGSIVSMERWVVLE